MGYRGIDPRRVQQQLEGIRQVAGHSIVWRRWLRSEPGDPDRGVGEQNVYEEQTIQGFINFVNADAMQTLAQEPVGQVPRQEVRLVTNFPLRSVDRTKDFIIYSDTTYRVEMASTPSKIAGQWVTILVRGEQG